MPQHLHRMRCKQFALILHTLLHLRQLGCIGQCIDLHAIGFQRPCRRIGQARSPFRIIAEEQ
ncbi:hypothetical protein D3C71_2019640 [compost metagenome]